MKIKVALVLSLGIVTSLPGSSFAQVSGRMTFGDAIELALHQAPEVASAREGVAAANFRVGGTRAQRYPKLHADANLYRWNEPLLIDFGSIAGPMGMPLDNTTMIVRDRYTSSAAISLSQPVSGLFVLGRMLDIDRSGVAGAHADVARTRLDTAQRAAEAYLRILQARAVAEVAEQSVTQIQAQLARAETMEAAGVMGKVDVLRLISARDAAKQNLVRATTNVEIAAGQLALALSLPPGTAMDVVDDFPDPPTPVTLSVSDVIRAAESDRPELQGEAEKVKQARGNKTVAAAQWLPNLMAVGTYQHITGQGPFQPQHAWYVGATLSWDIWDWGRTIDNVKEAGSRARQAALAQKALHQRIVMEARQKLLEAKAAFATLEPARTSLEAATEAHRIQTVRYEQGVASTTDIIDAETDLARARSAYAQARYDYYLSQAALARAAGALPFQPPKK